MSYNPVNLGAAPNDGQGDPLRDGGTKINTMFQELYNATSNTVPNGYTGRVTVTAGAVLFGDGTNALAIDATNLFWDDTNNILKIGGSPIGATTTDKLQVNGNASIGGVKISPFGIANLTTNSMAFSSSNVTSGTSGSFTLVSGDGSSTASSGSIGITSGTIISGPGNSGDVNIFSGGAINGNTGNVGVFSNSTTGSGDVGYAFIAGGAAGGAGAGGWVYINAGGSASGAKGEVQITKTDQVTNLLTLNDTGVGFFTATPVSARTSGGTLAGVIAGLVSLGLFGS